jgi:hypothetical protein
MDMNQYDRYHAWADIHQNSRDPTRIEILSPIRPGRSLIPFSARSIQARCSGRRAEVALHVSPERPGVVVASLICVMISSPGPRVKDNLSERLWDASAFTP